MTFTEMLPGLIKGKRYSQYLTKADGSVYMQDARYYLDNRYLIFSRHEKTHLDDWYESFTWTPSRHELVADIWEEV
jgi:hypothetical protein